MSSFLLWYCFFLLSLSPLAFLLFNFIRSFFQMPFMRGLKKKKCKAIEWMRFSFTLRELTCLVSVWAARSVFCRCESAYKPSIIDFLIVFYFLFYFHFSLCQRNLTPYLMLKTSHFPVHIFWQLNTFANCQVFLFGMRYGILHVKRTTIHTEIRKMKKKSK